MAVKNKKSFIIGGLLAIGIISSGCSDQEADKPKEDAPATEQQAQEEQDGPFVVYGDIVNSHFVEDAICVVNSRFEQGWRIVFRASVNDVESGELIEDANVKVVLGTGEEFDMELIPNGEEGTLLYSYAWTIPDDFPTGTLDYEIVADVNGEEYTYKPFDVSLSKMTIIEPTGDSGSEEE